MPRTVVPPAMRRSGAGGTTVGGDEFPERLVKYVPAEAISVFLTGSAFIGSDNSALLIALAAGALVLSILYLLNSARGLSKSKKPKPFFYVLSVIAFICWAPATNHDLARILGIDARWAGLAMIFAVPGIPLLDGLLSGKKVS